MIHSYSFSFHPLTQGTLLLDTLKQIKSNKASGFDGQPSRLMRIGTATPSRTLLPMNNQAISESPFPVDPEKAEVTPVFKKDDRIKRNIDLSVCICLCLKTIPVYYV